MDRARRRIAHFGFILGLVLLVAATGGCTAALTTAMYMLGYNDNPPEYEGLKNKKVAVVCRSQATMQYQDPRAAKDLGHLVSTLLKENGKKIKVIDQRKIDRWVDENTWDEFTEVGKATDAEMVVGVDIDHFQLHQGQTLYQGRANVSIKVYDLAKGEVVFEKEPAPIVYPPNSYIHTSEKAESQFRREFLRVIANVVARHFYTHDPYADYGQDVTAGL
jgi:hypothetical protein